ncbi:MAG TPA: hypothetical protein VGA18_01365 [Rhodothermales bacterium]
MSKIKNYASVLMLLCCISVLLSPNELAAQADAPTDTMMTAAPADTMMTATQWSEFSDNLKKAVASENLGVQTGALSQIIRYGHDLDFDDMTVFNVMRMYRDNEDPKVRRMAVVALGNMDNAWSIEFLDMLSRYEADPTIKKTMERVVMEHREIRMKK